MGGRASRQFTCLEHDDIRPPQESQMIRDAGARDARSYDHGACVLWCRCNGILPFGYVHVGRGSVPGAFGHDTSP